MQRLITFLGIGWLQRWWVGYIYLGTRKLGRLGEWLISWTVNWGQFPGVRISWD